MASSKIRWLLVASSILSFALSAALIFCFIFICLEGMINSFAYFGVLANFNDILGVISLLCLLFGLVLFKFGTGELKISRADPRKYQRNRITLICALIIYFGLICVSAFCIFETFNDISAVGQAFVSSNIGYIAIGVLIASFSAFVAVIVDLFVFKHDLSRGLISLTETNPQLLLAAPRNKINFKANQEINSTNENDYSRLSEQVQRLNEMKEKGIIDNEEYNAMKKSIIENYFDSD